jgi:DNA-binding PadR family transcriptional regulator
MSVRQGLLALLAEESAHGYHLKVGFESGTGGVWPLNVGQVYTTLDRLVRDGFVESAGEPDEEGRRSYRITREGREELEEWFAEPVDREPAARDELLVKVLLAARVGGIDVRDVIQVQRTATLEVLQGYRRRQQVAMRADDLAAVLALDALIARAEADARWLDTCEARLAPRMKARLSQSAAAKAVPPKSAARSAAKKGSGR